MSIFIISRVLSFLIIVSSIVRFSWAYNRTGTVIKIIPKCVGVKLYCVEQVVLFL